MRRLAINWNGKPSLKCNPLVVRQHEKQLQVNQVIRFVDFLQEIAKLGSHEVKDAEENKVLRFTLEEMLLTPKAWKAVLRDREESRVKRDRKTWEGMECLLDVPQRSTMAP